MSRKIYLLVLLAVALVGCRPSDEAKFSKTRLLRDITTLVGMKSGAAKRSETAFAGVWRSASSGTFLVVDDQGNAMTLSVNRMGKVTRAKDGAVTFNLSSPGNDSTVWAEKDGVIYRHNYDAMEAFDRVSE